MAVNVNTVYQTVLALANKEQRGYITPQEFNLFARLAQKEIFEQYFYDINQFKRLPAYNDYSTDPCDVIYDKLTKFVVSGYDADLNASNPTAATNKRFDLPTNFYKFHRAQTSLTSTGVEIEKLGKKEFFDAMRSPLTRGTNKRPIMYIDTGAMSIWVNSDNVPDVLTTINFSYYRIPSEPKWTYTVINNKPLWNPSVSAGAKHFEIHPAEESRLVYKILQMAGVAIEDPAVTQVAGQAEANIIGQQKQ